MTKLKVYRATLDNNGNWGNLEDLPLNSDDYSVAHPTLSIDEKTLYFASDMPRTLGISDIFKVAINEDGTFGVPINLGTEISTESRESFPFISSDNTLYFASDGRPGLGGLDIFRADLDGSNKVVAVNNVGMPINSKADDFNFIINDKSKKGYFSSNREGGVGSDDIYSLSERPIYKAPGKTIVVIVKDKDSGELLKDAKVALANNGGIPELEAVTSTEGKVSFDNIIKKGYFVKTSKKDYSTAEKAVQIDVNEITVLLDRNLVYANVKDELGLTLKLNPILFDLDNSNIRPDVEIELSKIKAAMDKYPTLNIAIRSHTDNRGSSKYNLALSERRAKSTMKYLVTSGIDKDRLTAKGYGESIPLIDCLASVNCDEEMYQKNRRSEFVILE